MERAADADAAVARRDMEGRTTPIDQLDREDVMAAIREKFASHGFPRNREQAIHDMAYALGYARTGKRVREVLAADLQTAVRRGILDNARGAYTLLCRSIDQYALDHLVAMLLAAMGGGWQTRDDAITAAARHMGYRRTGRNMRAAFKSAINAGLRRGRLQRDGQEWIRKRR